MSTMYIFRGLPGSGKTTAANRLGCLVISPQDMFAMRDGKYCFDDKNRKKANDTAEEILCAAMRTGMDVAIAEVLPFLEKVERYKQAARSFGYKIVIQDMPCKVEESLARNVHNVPENVIRSMADAFTPYIEEE